MRLFLHMPRSSFWPWAVALWAVIVPAVFGAQTQARLVLANEATTPGSTVLAGVHLHMNKGWHTYWRNPGDAGGATEIKWQLPEGVSAGEILWPVPEKYTEAGLHGYVFHNDIVLLVPLSFGNKVATGPLEIAANVSWLECEKVCVPGEEDIKATIQIGQAAKPSAGARVLEEAKARLPGDGSFLQPQASWFEGPPNDAVRTLVLEWTTTNQWTAPDFFPFESKDFEVAGDTDVVMNKDGKVRIHKTVKKLEGNWPQYAAGLIVGKPAGAKALEGFQVQVPIGARSASFAGGSLLGMLGLAFLGGLILNIMPCVLPVIALKIFSFVNQAGQNPGRVRLLGSVYGVGVVASFLVLAALAIAVQQAGGTATWGMALQNQVFRVLLTILMTLVALNLFGLFEVTLSGSAMAAADQAASKEGMPGAFFNGVLATVLATPCTAPFLTVALAFAFTQPAAVTLAVFAAAGLGLAAPFVLLSWKPGWLKALPRPGAWMEKFKIAMGFPMLATAVWLFWFTAPRYGKSGVLWFGLFLVVLAAAAWTFGEFYQRSRARRGLALVMVAVLVALGYFGILEGQLSWRKAIVRTSAADSLKEGPDGIDWQPWSPEALAKARAAGHPVLVDFTADNCLNCQVNKKTSLEIASTRAKLKEIGAVALLGDFSDQDARIAAELRKFGRPGVPLVLVYPKDPDAPPIVLPEILSPRLVRDALNKAAGSDGLNLVTQGASQ